MDHRAFYLAPMEGITGYVFRNAYHRFFPDFNKYFLPFISPNPKGKFAPWEEADLAKEHNQGMVAIPQILTNQSEEFIATAKQLLSYGYQEVNLNLGCPSRTVVKKNRGSGFLSETVALERFLDQIYSELDMRISIKTRIGRWDSEEFEELLKIYNRFPISELIIHPRVQGDYYGNVPNLDVFRHAVLESKNPVSYNGDLFTKSDYKEWSRTFPEVNSVMLGRGVLKNPGILGEILYGNYASLEQYQGFHDALLEGYLQSMQTEKYAIFKMKEIWAYLKDSFQEPESHLQSIRKANTKEEYEEAVQMLFQNIEIKRARVVD